MVDRLNRGFAHRSGHDLGVCDMLLSLALARSRVCRAVRRHIATRNERPGKRSLCSAFHGDGCRRNFCFQFASSELGGVVFPDGYPARIREPSCACWLAPRTIERIWVGQTSGSLSARRLKVVRHLETFP